MRCKACNVALSDKESVIKDKETEEYYDLCFNCLDWSQDATEDPREDIYGLIDPEGSQEIHLTYSQEEF